jgi:hypothetical protein
MSNYRPISLLLSLSKVLEALMFKRLNQHLQLNKILAPGQFRFRKETNIENAVFTLTDIIHTSLNHLKQIVGTFRDLSKAFECINLVILRNKLFYSGVGGTCYYWIKSCLTNRKQTVNTSTHYLGEESSSNWKTIVSGVSQVSILGSLLFLVYIHDLLYGIYHTTEPVVYAEDTSV